MVRMMSEVRLGKGSIQVKRKTRMRKRAKRVVPLTGAKSGAAGGESLVCGAGPPETRTGFPLHADKTLDGFIRVWCVARAPSFFPFLELDGNN